MWRMAVAAALTILTTTTAAVSDEIVRTTDGRAFLLRSDGTYSEVRGSGPGALTDAIATATAYASDKARILTCAEKEPDDAGMMRQYFADDETKTRSLWLAVGGSEAGWSEIETALQKQINAAVDDCAAVIDGWARLEPFSWPLSHRSPFKEMNQ